MTRLESIALAAQMARSGDVAMARAFVAATVPCPRVVVIEVNRTTPIEPRGYSRGRR